MDRDNQKIPGFGFDQGYEPSPPSTQPPASSTHSIFGLISKVNKGILKQPQTVTQSPPGKDQSNQGILQARSVAQKLSSISPQLAKQRAFETARSSVVNIQRGIWNPPVADPNKHASSNSGFKPPVADPNKHASSNSGFKVPFAAPKAKQLTPANKQGMNTGTQDQRRIVQQQHSTIYSFQHGVCKPKDIEPAFIKPKSLEQTFCKPKTLEQTFSKPKSLEQSVTKAKSVEQGFIKPKSLVAYDEEEVSNQSSNFTRQKALEEIDRYRIRSNRQSRDILYEEESRKQNEPFKSDFDRYYYGNESQRSEIAGKLYRTDPVDNFSSGKDYTSRNYDNYPKKENDLEDEFGNDNFRRNDYSSDVSYTTGSDYKGTYDDRHDRLTKEDSIPLNDDNNAAKENYYEEKSNCNDSDNKGYISSDRDSSSYSNRIESDSEINEGKDSYMGGYDAYIHDTRSINIRQNNDISSRTESPTVFDYDHTASHNTSDDSHTVSYKAVKATNESENPYDRDDYDDDEEEDCYNKDSRSSNNKNIDSQDNKRENKSSNNRDIYSQDNNSDSRSSNNRDIYSQDNKRQNRSSSNRDIYSQNNSRDNRSSNNRDVNIPDNKGENRFSNNRDISSQANNRDNRASNNRDIYSRDNKGENRSSNSRDIYSQNNNRHNRSSNNRDTDSQDNKGENRSSNNRDTDSQDNNGENRSSNNRDISSQANNRASNNRDIYSRDNKGENRSSNNRDIYSQENNRHNRSTKNRDTDSQDNKGENRSSNNRDIYSRDNKGENRSSNNRDIYSQDNNRHNRSSNNRDTDSQDNKGENRSSNNRDIYSQDNKGEKRSSNNRDIDSQADNRASNNRDIYSLDNKRDSRSLNNRDIYRQDNKRDNRSSNNNYYSQDTESDSRSSKNRNDYNRDNYYRRDRPDEQHDDDYENEEYGGNMANMEEFTEDGDHADGKSQDGDMLYEDFLFGEENEDVSKIDCSSDSRGSVPRMSADRGSKLDSSSDDRGNIHVSRKSGDQFDESRTDNFRDKNRYDERFDHDFDHNDDHDSGRIRRDNRIRDAEHRNNYRSEDRSSFNDRRTDDEVGRTMSITDDQKAQGAAPVLPNKAASDPKPVPPPAVLQVVPTIGLAPIAIPSAHGIVCMDCSVTCTDQDVYNAHLKSDMHLLTLQRKAQELFHMESRQSRFDTDAAGHPLKASILPPTTMITGIPSSTLTNSVAHLELGRNVFTGTVPSPISTDRDRSVDSPTRYRTRSEATDVQIIPPKPLGPLETRSVQCTWLIVQWRTRHDEEEALIEKYVVEYRNAREIRWVRVGTTIQHEYEVNGLQEGTDYLFRVYTINRNERSEFLESVLVTTKKWRDTPDRTRRRSSREIERDRNRRSSREAERERRISREERDRKQHIRVADRKLSGDRDRQLNRDRVRGGRDSNTNRSRNRITAKRKPVRDNRQNKVEKKPNTEQNKREENKRPSRRRDRSERSDGNVEHKEVDKSEDVKPHEDEEQGVKQDDEKQEEEKQQEVGKEDEKQEEEKQQEVEQREVDHQQDVDQQEATKIEDEVYEDVECLLYREFSYYENEPMLGLDNIFEIRSYMSAHPPRYVCKLCNNKGSHKVIMRHVVGFPHKLNYFKKHDGDVYQIINMIALRKQQVDRANYEARLVEDKQGRGKVRVMLMLNPEDHHGKVVYKDPIPVEAPAPAREKEDGEVPEAADVTFQSQFEVIYNEAVETGTLVDNTLIGLNYIKEILHPKMEKDPKYSCGMCSVLCYSTTIISHLVGKRHRLNYLKAHHEDVYDAVINAKDQKHQLLFDKIKEFAEKDGPGSVKTKVARSARMWRDKTSKVVDSEAQVEEMEEGNLEEPHSEEQEADHRAAGAGLQAIKFGIKKTEATPTNVKLTNILELQQATTKVKEGFDWNKENSLLQARINNETIIKSSRKPKFLTVYSEFFKRIPVIGMQWVTEFQKPDMKQEPWYMCFMCQQKLLWKSILDHVTSNLHRLNYMKKSNYRDNAVYHMIKTDKQAAKPLIEQYSKEIAKLEGPPTQIEVMLELKINTEAFKSVAKVQENVKAHSSASSAAATSQPSIQINIASTSLPAAKTPREQSSTVIEQSSVPVSQTQAPPMATVPVVQWTPGTDVTGQTPGAIPLQIQAPLLRPPPMGHRPLRPPPQRPPSSTGIAVAPNMSLPPPLMQTGQRFPSASVPPPLFPFQNTPNVSAPSGSFGTTRPEVPPFSIATDISIARGPMPMMMPQSTNTLHITPGHIQPEYLIPGPVQKPPPLFPGLMPRPPMTSGVAYSGPNLPQQPGQARFGLPLPMHQPLIQGQLPRFPLQPPGSYNMLQTPVSSTAVDSVINPVVTIPPQPQEPIPLLNRPPPWQTQAGICQNAPVHLLELVGSLASDMAPNVAPQIANDPWDPTTATMQLKTGQSNLTNLHDIKHEKYGHMPQEYKKEPWLGRKTTAETKKGTVRSDVSSKNTNESDRGTKRSSKERGDFDRNKRLRKDDRIYTPRHKNASNPQRSSSSGSSSGRLSQEHESRRGGDRRKNDRDRRSRSPDRRRGPFESRVMDNYSRNRDERFPRMSECRPSPRRETRGRERHQGDHFEDREEYFDVKDEQLPIDDYNAPLDAEKVDDLVRRYSHRVDDDYNKVMGVETEFVENMAGRGINESSDYEKYDRRNEMYFKERDNQQTEYDRSNVQSRRNLIEDRYEINRRNIPDNRSVDRHDEREWFDSRYDYGREDQPASGDSERDQNIRSSEFCVEREYIDDNRRGRTSDIQRFNNSGDDNMNELPEQKQFRREEIHRSDDFRQVEEHRHGIFQREDDQQRTFSRDQGHRPEVYNRDERHFVAAIDDMDDYSRGIPRGRPGYEQDVGREPDRDRDQYDRLSDPPRSEIDELLRRATTMVTPPQENFNDYEDEEPREDLNRQVGSLANLRRGRGRGGYRGRGPRRGR